MIRRHIVILSVLVLLCAGAFGIYMNSGSRRTAEEATKEQPGQLPEIESKEQLTVQPVHLTVDGQPAMEGRVHLTPEGELMLPVDELEDTFGCAVSSYKGTSYIIRKNIFRLDLEADDYLPAQSIADGLGYSLTWNERDNTAVMVNQNPGMSLLPVSYDYRREGRAPRVKNQGTLGTCWSFASLMALESSLLPFEDYDFSEDHMTLKNSFGLSQNDGGEYTMALAYLLAWQGPVLEKDDPYGDGYSPDGLKPVKHVQDVRILPEKNYDKIKEAVFRYGGVQSSLYTLMKDRESTRAAYGFLEKQKPNHDVVIVGWDDDYSRDNFSEEMPGNGAFLCINSWGEEFGEDGYFYVSYYDANIGIYNIVYTGIEDADNYDRIYQTDLCGWIGQLGYGRDTVYIANVYEAGKGETLEAAGFYATGPGTEYEIYTASDVTGPESFTERSLAAKGILEDTGFYTIRLETPVPLKDDERFAVIVKITTPGAIQPAAIEYKADDNKRNVDISDGEGYLSLHGDSWENVEKTQNCNICLKVYTTKK